MYNILNLPKEERRTIFRNTAQKMKVHEAIIEKDYWVCLALDCLFHKSRFQKHLTFKGGTSLSKCFGLIQRFSEDIDLILDWRLLGYEKDEPWAERSKTKQDAFNKEANAKTACFIANKFIPTFISDISECIGEKANIVLDKNDHQTIHFQYPLLFDSQRLMQSIRLEIGTLAAWSPAIEKAVKPYIFETYPQLAQKESTGIITSSVERTFWEKVTILHHEANRPAGLDMPMRYSRHYYDLYCIGNTEYKVSAFKQLELLQKVVVFKMKFYPRAWAKYEEALPGSIKLLPPHDRLETLRVDYAKMEEMLFGDHPSFDELLNSIEKLENEINSLSLSRKK